MCASGDFKFIVFRARLYDINGFLVRLRQLEKSLLCASGSYKFIVFRAWLYDIKGFHVRLRQPVKSLLCASGNFKFIVFRTWLHDFKGFLCVGFASLLKVYCVLQANFGIQKKEEIAEISAQTIT